MARRRRYNIPGAFYHVMMRGNNKQKIFFNDIDRCRMCFLIQQGVEKYGHRIHAFCFMANHIHLLVQVSHISISKIVHNLAFRYCHEINKRYGKIGHLFQGRFKSILIDESDYFLKLLRYIHMNPVRAKLVNEPEEYFWSGHRAYLGKDFITWLTKDNALSKFDSYLDRAQKHYEEYSLTKAPQEELDTFRKDFKDGQILGSEEFIEEVREKFETKEYSIDYLPLIVDAACEVFGIEKYMLSSNNRSKQLALARGAIVSHGQEKGFSLEEIGPVLSRSESSLSRMQNEFLKIVQKSNGLKEEIEKFKTRVCQLTNFDFSMPDTQS